MAQMDDLRATLDAIDTKLDDVRASITRVGDEVAALLAVVPPDLTEVLAHAKAIAAETQAASDMLSAIPPAPTV